MSQRNKNQGTLTGSILWVDGKRAGDASFIPGLREKGLTIENVPTGKAALTSLVSFSPDIIVVDAQSMRTSGLRICQSIHESADGKTPIILIANPDRPVKKDPSIRFSLTQPFTIRKIYNRIAALLPSDGNNVIKAGDIALDLERSVVMCCGRERQLTPRLTKLLRMLMAEPGSVIRREVLFQEVWNTDYIGDTRTLDVHISWLRKAFEENPRKPKYLKTVRGVGYRLDP